MYFPRLLCVGAVNNKGGDATDTDCVLESNSALNGGGMAAINVSSASVTNCLMVDNHASGLYGALQSTNQGTPSLRNCTIGDFDSDSDIDFADFASFQQVFTEN